MAKEKVAGVFEVFNEKTKHVYFGRSKDLDAILRTVKSKLRNNKFHNKSLQDEFNEYEIGCYRFYKHTPEKGRDILDLILDLEEDALEDNKKLHNKADILELEGKKIEVDKYGLDDLSRKQKSIVDRILESFSSGANEDELSMILLNKGI